jgi:hypothetical protein
LTSGPRSVLSFIDRRRHGSRSLLLNHRSAVRTPMPDLQLGIRVDERRERAIKVTG